jgi:hypothetical protein
MRVLGSARQIGRAVLATPFLLSSVSVSVAGSSIGLRSSQLPTRQNRYLGPSRPNTAQKPDMQRMFSISLLHQLIIKPNAWC